MIFVGLGANLPSPVHGTPLDTLKAALGAIEDAGIRIETASRWYESAPVPASDQPWFVNGVARVSVDGRATPETLLADLHRIEDAFGRERPEPNAPRILDLDLIAWKDRVCDGAPVLPHPRMHGRAFVLLPLAEVAPADWRHPVSKRPLGELIAALPDDQVARPLGDG